MYVYMYIVNYFYQEIRQQHFFYIYMYVCMYILPKSIEFYLNIYFIPSS